MRSTQDIAAARSALAEKIAERYKLRTEPRQQRMLEVTRRGPFGGAPRAEVFARTANLTPIEGRNLEATFGNYDIDQVNFLSRGLKASRPVCRIVSAGSSWGTGFLVAPGLLMTNNHVLEDEESARACLAEFNYEYDAEDLPLVRKIFELDPSDVFITSPSSALDFTLVALRDPDRASRVFGWLPLDPRTNKIVEGEPAVCIEHPGQEDKKLCLFDSELVDRINDPAMPYLHYTTDTEKGSSGSPVFNRSWQVIALHHGSCTVQELDPKTNEQRPKGVNEGVRISRIVDGLRTGANITVGSEPLRSRIVGMLAAPDVLGNSRPQGPAIAMNIGGASTELAQTASSTQSRFEAEANRTVIRTPPKSHYVGRKGYREDFLGKGELLVPMPSLAPAMQSDVAPLLESNAKFVLKYTHYSVIMCASRRIAYVSACNIDGATNPANFDRKKRLDIEFESTRSDFEPEQAADRWYFDPRMALEYQPGPEIYDDRATKFDFGHITRRMDVVWGADEDEMLHGSDDSFHMTNCSPQVSSYNQHGDWGSLEDAIAKFARGASAKSEPRKVSVFSGPVLHPSDHSVLGIKVPNAFWKVIAFVEGDALRSLAFLASQKELVEEERKKLESTKLLAKTAFGNEWLTTVRDISRLTSLDFGPLLDADYFAAQGKSKEAITEELLDSLFS